MNQFKAVPWDLQVERRLSPKPGCAGTGYLMNSFLWVMLVLSGCRGCLGFLQGTFNIPMGPFSQSLSRFQRLRSYRGNFHPLISANTLQNSTQGIHNYLPSGYHLVTWLHQTGGGNLFPCEMWSHKNPWDGRHCNAPCMALLPPTEAGDLAQLCCSLTLIKKIFHKWKCKRRRLESATLSPSHCSVWEIWRSKFLIRNLGRGILFR